MAASVRAARRIHAFSAFSMALIAIPTTISRKPSSPPVKASPYTTTAVVSPPANAPAVAGTAEEVKTSDARSAPV